MVLCLFSDVSLEPMFTVTSRLGFSQLVQKLETQHSELFEVKARGFCSSSIFFSSRNQAEACHHSFCLSVQLDGCFLLSPLPHRDRIS